MDFCLCEHACTKVPMSVCAGFVVAVAIVAWLQQNYEKWRAHTITYRKKKKKLHTQINRSEGKKKWNEREKKN